MQEYHCKEGNITGNAGILLERREYHWVRKEYHWECKNLTGEEGISLGEEEISLGRRKHHWVTGGILLGRRLGRVNFYYWALGSIIRFVLPHSTTVLMAQYEYMYF